jgi:hypothetical protein
MEYELTHYTIPAYLCHIVRLRVKHFFQQPLLTPPISILLHLASQGVLYTYTKRSIQLQFQDSDWLRDGQLREFESR